MTLTENTVAAVALALLASACSPAKPANPSFAADVAPIFNAHCTRCHSANGADGGFLNDPVAMTTPKVCHFDFYEGDPATCAGNDGGVPPPPCQGALYCGKTYNNIIRQYIDGVGKPMPPPPASLMNDWGRDVVERWLASCDGGTCTP